MGNCYSIIKPHDIADCQNHSFRTKVFKETRECLVCQDIIWNEGRSCKVCKFPCHKRCEYKVLTACATSAKNKLPKNEEIKPKTLNQRNLEESKHKMMSPGVEVNNRTITSSDGPVRYTFDLDVDYITERFIAMSFPSGGPEAQYRSNLRDVVNMLKTKHSNNYIIFNLSKRRNDIIKMNDQVLDVGWHDSLAPPLERLCSICKQIETWLKKDPQNVAVLHCKGSRSPIGVVVLAYMNYISITANSDSALDRYAMKRFMEAKTDHHMQPSQFRYEGYFTGLLTGAISINSSPLYLHHIAIHGVPNYDANGGCKPFIRIYQGMQNVYTSGVYTVPEGTTRFVVSLDKALPLRGDILVKCYHKKFRSSTRDVVFRCQFHTTAVVEYRLLFGKEDLDDSCTDARFPPFTKVELIFSSTGDRLHNSDYISQSNFAVDNTEDPLIRWDSYENFSKLIEGSDFEADTPEPNSGDNNNLPPGSTKYIYAPDGSPYAQVQKGLPYGRSEEPIVQSQPPQQMQQSPPPVVQTNGPNRQNAYTNGPTGGTPAQNGPIRGPPGTNPAVRGVERTPSGRQMDFKEQRDLEELLKGIEDPSDLQGGGMKTNGPVPGSPQKSQMVESPGNRRIVSVHAELKTAPAATKRTIQPVRPIREEEFENLSTPTKEESGPPGVSSPPITRTGPVEEQMIAPARIQAAESAPPYGNFQAASPGQGTRPIPNGNAGKERVPLEHANPTYDYTQHGRTTPNRTGGMIEEPITEVRLKAGPVSVQSLESSPPRSVHQTAPSNSSLKGSYEPQPLQAQQQKIKFITKYDDEDPNHHDQTSPSRPQQTPRDSEDSQLWLKRQQGKMRGHGERDGGHHDPYQPERHSYQQERYPVHEPGMQSTHRGNVHQAPPRSFTPTNPPTYPSGPHSPSSSIKSEPVTTGGRYVPDNLSWLEQQQMKLREKRHRERLGMDPSHPLQVDTSYSVGQVPSQPSSVSSIRSDVSGFSNTPYTQQRLTDTAAGMATRRGYHPEPINVAQHPPRRGPPTPAQGYDNMATTPRQAVQSPDRALEHGHAYHHQQIVSKHETNLNAANGREQTGLSTGAYRYKTDPHRTLAKSGDGGRLGEGDTDRRALRGEKLTGAHQYLNQDQYSDPYRKEQVVDAEMLPSRLGLEFQDGSGSPLRGGGKSSLVEGRSPQVEGKPPNHNMYSSKSKEHDSGYCSSSSSNKSQSPKSGQGKGVGGIEKGSKDASIAAQKSKKGDADQPGHQTSQKFLQHFVSRSVQRNRSHSLNEDEPPNHLAPLDSSRTIPPTSPSKPQPKGDGGLGGQMLPTYDWVINRIRELRHSQERTISPGGGSMSSGSHGVRITPMDSSSEASGSTISQPAMSVGEGESGRNTPSGSQTIKGGSHGFSTVSNVSRNTSSMSGNQHDITSHPGQLPHTGLQIRSNVHSHTGTHSHQSTPSETVSIEPSLIGSKTQTSSNMGGSVTSAPVGFTRTSRSDDRHDNSSVRSRSETREYVPREGTVRRIRGGRQGGLWVQERSKHVHRGTPPIVATNLHEANPLLQYKLATNSRQPTNPIRSEKSRRVHGNLALTKELDDAMRTLQIWGDRIQALSSMCPEPDTPSRNPSIEPTRPSNPNQQGDQTPQRSQSLNQHRPRGTGLHIDEPVARPAQAAQQQAQINTNNSANVYSPNIYAPDTSLPTMRHAPVSRNDSLGGYESDSAIHCVPSKLRPGEAEQWLQNPGGLPSRENVHWNRVEGLHLPEERSPRDMHSSNESIPNGGTTPKFPVGPKGYANMVKTCIAVVGKPPHGPDEPLPLSPIGGRREDVLETTLPRQPEPARRQLQFRPMEEQPQPQLNVRPLQPITRPDQERPLHVRQLESTPDHRPSRGQAGPARSQPVDVESLEALLETVSPVEARGGVPNRPTGPGPYDGGRGASPPLRKGVLYTDIEIDPDRGTVKQTGERLRYETGPMAPRQNLEESRVYPTAAKEAQAMPHQARPLHQTPVRQPVDQMKPSLVEEALASPSRPTNQSQPRSPVEQDIWFKPSVSDQTQTAPPHQQRGAPNGYPSSQSYTQVPIVQSPAPQPMVEEPISKTELSPAKVVIQDLPLHVPQQRSPPQASQGPGDSRQQPAYGRQQQQPIQVTSGNPVWSEPPGRTPGAAQHGIPQYVPQPQRAIVDRHPQRSQQYSPQNVPSQERVQHNPGHYTSPHESIGQPVPQSSTPQQVPYQSVPSSPYQPTSYHQTPVSQPQAPSTQRVHIQETRREVTSTVPSQHWQDGPGQPPKQPMEHEPAVQRRQPEAHQPPQQYHQHDIMHQPQQPMTQRPMAHEPMVQQRQPSVQHTLPQQQQVPGYYPGSSQPVSPTYNPGPQQRPPVPQSPGSEPPSISFSEATPPPKHINELQSPIFGQKDVGGEQSNESPRGIDALGGPGPSYPIYSDRSKGRPPQPLYPTFSDRHRRGHLKMDEASIGQNGNYKTLYDNRSRGRMSSESDASAVSPGTTSPIRQAVSPAGPSPSPSGRSTPSNFYLMPFTSPYGSSSSLADPNKEHVRFVKDLSSWWYKPHITREEAIGLLRDKQPGTFVVRDSNSFPGAFGLAIKVSQPPANTQPRKAGDPSSELIRHFLIEPNTRGVRLKGCINEPVFGSLSALIYQHTLTQLALPCKLVLPEIDPAGVDSPDAIDPKSAAALLQQGAACNVLYMEMINMESLTGPSAVREGISRVMNMKEKPKGVKVHLKVSLKGVTVTDKARKLFFRKHYPVESILYCGMDPGTRKIARMEGQDTPDAKCFGIICRKPGSLTDNQCLVFAEYEVEQPASAIVSFVTKVLLGSKQAKTP